jgi:hypothetical protein
MDLEFEDVCRTLYKVGVCGRRYSVCGTADPAPRSVQACCKHAISQFGADRDFLQSFFAALNISKFKQIEVLSHRVLNFSLPVTGDKSA